MNRREIETFRRKVRDLLDRYERALAQLEVDESARREVAPASLRGRGRQIALEAHGRLYLLDPLLEELGWDVEIPVNIVIEDTVDPPEGEADAEKRRLDYHGRDNEQKRSLLVVEVKRPRQRLPNTDGAAIASWLADAVGLINRKDEDAEELPAGWREILKSAADYVSRIKEAFASVPIRFVITNGEWFIVFSDLEATLLAEDPAVDNIDVFLDLADVTARAERFCELLGYRSLSGYIPPQHPSRLAEFIPDGREAECARYLEVSYARHGERQPVLSVSVGVWVRTPRGAWIQFRKDYPKQFLVLSDEPDQLAARRDEIRGRADSLIAELRAQRPVRFVPHSEFEGAVEDGEDGGAQSTRSVLVRDLGGDRYRVVTADKLLFFTEDTTFDGCPYHSWGPCRNDGNAVGDAAIAAQSSEPRCFFPSGSPYHCAHAVIQAQRDRACLLLPFEEYLCCRRCAFRERCWPDTAVMPCRRN